MNNGLFIYPTDTVWGIGASIESEELTLKILKVKRIDSFRPFSIMFAHEDQLREFVNLPQGFTSEWLQKFFKLESTLLVPKKWCNQEVGTWITGDSAHVGLRCLNFKEIQEIYDRIGGPFTSTSLNLTGEEPITESEKAFDFFKLNCPDENFIECKNIVISGNSSTVVMINESSSPKILREGNYVSDIKSHLGLLST